jgi:hypothetical protein
MPRGIFIALFVLISSACSVFAEVDPPPIRFGFFPKHGEDVIYRIEFSQESTFRTQTLRHRWTHELVINISGTKPPDSVVGHFIIRNVVNDENAAADPFFAIARAIEGERFALTMLSYGVPVEVDWPAIRRRVESNPDKSEPRLAASMPKILSMFPPDGVDAVMRALWVTSIPHLRTFARDGSKTTVTGVDLPAYYPVKGGTVLETYGGTVEGTQDLMFVWKLTSDPKLAAQALAPQLRAIADAVTPAGEQIQTRRLVDDAITAGIDVVEGGIAEFDLTPGLIRRTSFQTRLTAGLFKSETSILITRLAPE